MKVLTPSFMLTLLLTLMEMFTKTTDILPSQAPEYPRNPDFNIIINIQVPISEEENENRTA